MKKQVAIRLEENFYKEIRLKLLKEDKTFQEYVENLIKEDMEKGNK